MSGEINNNLVLTLQFYHHTITFVCVFINIKRIYIFSEYFKKTSARGRIFIISFTHVSDESHVLARGWVENSIVSDSYGVVQTSPYHVCIPIFIYKAIFYFS